MARALIQAVATARHRSFMRQLEACIFLAATENPAIIMVRVDDGITVLLTMIVGFLSDMWRFEITSQLWTPLGPPAAVNSCDANKPCGVSNMAYSYDPISQELYMFGGLSASSKGGGILSNDSSLVHQSIGFSAEFWRFSVTSTLWTKILTQPNVPYPVARMQSSAYFDPKTRSFYLFGGLLGTGRFFFDVSSPVKQHHPLFAYLVSSFAYHDITRCLRITTSSVDGVS